MKGVWKKLISEEEEVNELPENEINIIEDIVQLGNTWILN